MHHIRFERFLWNQVLLFSVLGATLGLLLAYGSLRHPYHLPELRLVLATVYTLSGGLVAVLSATRFGVEGRRFDLFLCCGFFITSISWLMFSVFPAITQHSAHRTELWAAIAGPLVGWGLIAVAPFARGRINHRRFVLGYSLAACVGVLVVVWAMTRWLGFAMPAIDPARAQSVPASLTGALAIAALLCLLSLIGFGNRFRTNGEDLDYWLALVATLMLFSSLHFIFTPLVHVGDVSQGDFLRLLASGVLLVAVGRALRAPAFGPPVGW